MSQDLVEYFIEQTNERFKSLEDKVDQRLSGVEGKVDKLFQFKWQIIGGAGLLSFLVTIIFEILNTK